MAADRTDRPLRVVQDDERATPRVTWEDALREIKDQKPKPPVYRLGAVYEDHPEIRGKRR